MRIFANCVEAIKELPREVFTRGVTATDATIQGVNIAGNKEFEQKEVVGMAYTINNLTDKDQMLEHASKIFGKTHLRKDIVERWMQNIFSDNFVYEDWWLMDPYTKKYFEDFCNEGTAENPKTAYTYAQRIMPQIQGVINRLKKNVYARGAYIAVHQDEDIHKIGHRIPCTLSYGFSVRNSLEGNKLSMFLHMRSQDLCNFMALDIYKAIALLEYVAKELNLKVGKLICYVDSLHAYNRDIKDVTIKW